MTILDVFASIGVTLYMANAAFVDGLRSVISIPPLILGSIVNLPELFQGAVLVVFGFALIKFVLSFF